MAGKSDMRPLVGRLLANRFTSSKTSKIAGGNDLPRITQPRHALRKLQRLGSNRRAALDSRSGSSQTVIVACRRSEYNHHANQGYSSLKLDDLASSGWCHKKSKGDYFTINAHRKAPSFSTDAQSFEQLGITSRKLLENLQQLNVVKPTNIQAQTIPRLLAGENVICAAETGSGKTLAYLLPTLQKVHSYKRSLQGQIDFNVGRRPLALVLAPSRELVDQISGIATSVLASTPLFVKALCGGRGTRAAIAGMKSDAGDSPSDLLVATPGVLKMFVSSGVFDTSLLSSIVLDEADTLLDDSFNSLVVSLMQKLSLRPSGIEGFQISLVGATLPRDIKGILGDILPEESFTRVTTQHLHGLMAHVPQKFLRLGSQDKPGQIVKVVSSNAARHVPTIVFCNKSATSEYVHRLLLENGIKNTLLNGKIPEKMRGGRFQEFQDGLGTVLVATDVASRGLDTIKAQQVINYDFPEAMSDYIHRAGRVGRVGSGNCSVVSFVTYKWDVNLLWKIEMTVRSRAAQLPNVDANIKRKLSSMIQRKFGSKDDELDDTEPDDSRSS